MAPTMPRRPWGYSQRHSMPRDTCPHPAPPAWSGGLAKGRKWRSSGRRKGRKKKKQPTISGSSPVGGAFSAGFNRCGHPVRGLGHHRDHGDEHHAHHACLGMCRQSRDDHCCGGRHLVGHPCVDHTGYVSEREREREVCVCVCVCVCVVY